MHRPRTCDLQGPQLRRAADAGAATQIRLWSRAVTVAEHSQDVDPGDSEEV